MTSDELAEIEARANAATPGPWSRTLTPGRDKARAWLLEAFDASDGAAQVFVCGMLVMFAVPAPTTKRKAKKR